MNAAVYPTLRLAGYAYALASTVTLRGGWFAYRKDQE